MLAAGVVEMLAGGKDLHRLHAGSPGKFQQAWMQPLVQERWVRALAEWSRIVPRAGPWLSKGPFAFSYFRIFTTSRLLRTVIPAATSGCPRSRF